MDRSVKQLDRGPDAAPLYRQVTHTLLAMVEEMDSGDRFPTDRELTELFNVSRITIHQAVRDLVRFGYLQRIQGKGTFVSRPKIERDEPRLNSFSEDMRALGHRPGAKLLVHNTSVPDDYVKQKLKLVPEEKTLYLERLMLADDEPIALLYTHLPIRFCTNFEDWFSPQALDDAC
jgi:GntR family transcriptional regulator